MISERYSGLPDLDRYKRMGEQSKLSLRKAVASLATEYADTLLFEDGSISAITKRSNMRSMVIFIFECVLFKDVLNGPYTYRVKVGGVRKKVDLDPDDDSYKSQSNPLIRMSDFTMRMYGADVSLRDIVHSVIPTGYDGGDSSDWDSRIESVENMIDQAYVWLKGDMN